MHDNGSLIFDALLGALVFLGSFVPRGKASSDEPDAALLGIWKGRLALLLRFAGLALFLLAVTRLLAT